MQVPIVYVHGFIGHFDFAELREGLDASRVISPALLGYGEHASRMAYGLADQVSHLAQVISATFGTEPVVLVGHSGGAAVCVEFAATHPGQVAVLVSAEGNLSPSDAFLSSRLAPMTPDRVQAWLDHARVDPSGFCARERMSLLGQALERLREWLHHQSAPVIHTMARSLLIETVHPRYASVVMQVMTRIPTYLIEGALSEVALGAPPRLRALAQGIVRIPDAGHLMILEQPLAVAAALRALLSPDGSSITHPAPSSALG